MGNSTQTKYELCIVGKQQQKWCGLDPGVSLFLKFTTQGFLNNTASESRAFIRAGKHHLNGQAENGWIKLFFPLFNGSDSQKIQSRLGEE